MIADIQTQDLVSVSLENDVQYTIVQNDELADVSGGSGMCYF